MKREEVMQKQPWLRQVPGFSSGTRWDKASRTPWEGTQVGRFSRKFLTSLLCLALLILTLEPASLAAAKSVGTVNFDSYLPSAAEIPPGFVEQPDRDQQLNGPGAQGVVKWYVRQ